jgi:hypothetical protein
MLLNNNNNELITIFIQGVSAKIFESNISVICQRIFMKFKIQIFSCKPDVFRERVSPYSVDDQFFDVNLK